MEAITEILECLEQEGIEVLCVERRLVRCPGESLHTTPNQITDCMVWNNGGTARLYCLHRHCDGKVEQKNQRLARRARANGVRPARADSSNSARIYNRGIDSRKSLEVLDMIQTDFSWTYNEICNDPRGIVDLPPEDHYFLILSLFNDDDIVWIGRDVRDTGTEGRRERFASVNEWMRKGRRDGVFTCPSTFKPGVFSRCDDNVLTRPFLVIEADDLTHDQTGAVFRWMEALGYCLRAVVDTAGKSLHGWFDCPPTSELPRLKWELGALKCDTKMFSPSQPCRLPGALRDGRYQRLIYFNPPTHFVNAS